MSIHQTTSTTRPRPIPRSGTSPYPLRPKEQEGTTHLVHESSNVIDLVMQQHPELLPCVVLSKGLECVEQLFLLRGFARVGGGVSGPGGIGGDGGSGGSHCETECDLVRRWRGSGSNGENKRQALGRETR